MLVTGAIVCLGALLLPTEGDPLPTSIPSYLHLHTNMKVVIGFALGKLPQLLYHSNALW